jgi:hypothetical protein
MNFLKRQFPLILAFVMGLVFIIQYFVPHQSSQDLQSWINKWIMIIGGIASFLGVGSLIHFHYTKIKRKSEGWGFSVILYTGFILAFLAGFLPMLIPAVMKGIFKIDAPQAVWGIKMVGGIEPDGPLDWLFNSMINPMSATMFSIIGFFIASAAFRAFRARSLEATLLLIAAVIIMLGQTPLGGLIWSGIPDIMTWILTIPNTGAKRAILFGIALGSLAFSLRIIMGIERAYLGGKD